MKPTMQVMALCLLLLGQAGNTFASESTVADDSEATPTPTAETTTSTTVPPTTAPPVITPAPNPCMNGGIPLTDKTEKCACKSGFTGDLCEKSDLDNLQKCEAGVCFNSGVCQINAESKVSCDCINAYVGISCETRATILQLQAWMFQKDIRLTWNDELLDSNSALYQTAVIGAINTTTTSLTNGGNANLAAAFNKIEFGKFFEQSAEAKESYAGVELLLLFDGSSEAITKEKVENQLIEGAPPPQFNEIGPDLTQKETLLVLQYDICASKYRDCSSGASCTPRENSFTCQCPMLDIDYSSLQYLADGRICTFNVGLGLLISALIMLPFVIGAFVLVGIRRRHRARRLQQYAFYNSRDQLVTEPAFELST